VTGATFVYIDNALPRKLDRRLSIAVGLSVLIHALGMASYRGVVPTRYADAEGGALSFTALQVVLAESRTQSEQLESVAPVLATDADVLLSPISNPFEIAIRSMLPPAALPGSAPTKAGAGGPDVNISVGMIDDPLKLGPVYGAYYVVALAQRFPQRVGKAPALRGSPVVMYPRAAAQSGAEGRIAALLTLDEDGKIVESKLLPEKTLFTSAVQDALKSTEFAPAEIDGKPVPYWAIVEFVFSIDHPAAPVAARRR
jgi:uncharacterized protein YhhL (DUF1145 family)